MSENHMLPEAIESRPEPGEIANLDRDITVQGETDAFSEEGALSKYGEYTNRDKAVGLAIHTASTAWNTFNRALRITSKVTGFFLSPVRRAANSSPMEPVRGRFEKLVERGEQEVDGWIQSGLSQEPRVVETAKQITDPIIMQVVDYLSVHPATQKLIQDQIGSLANESTELPQINILVRVLAGNYITYLQENPDQVKALVQKQAGEFIDHLSENPEQVQELVQGQSISMVDEIIDQVRERLVTSDSLLEALARRLFRKPPRSAVPEPPPEVKARALLARLPEDFPMVQPDQAELEESSHAD